MKAMIEATVLCPKCNFPMRNRDARVMHCGHAGCELSGQLFERPQVDLVTAVPPAEKRPAEKIRLTPGQLRVIRALAAGATTYDLLAAKLNQGKPTIATVMMDIKHRTGWGYKDQPKLLELARQQGWLEGAVELPKPPLVVPPPTPVVTKAPLPGKPDSLPKPIIPAAAPKPPPRPASVHGFNQQPATLVNEPDDSNATWQPGDVKAIALGRRIPEPFGITDISARLDHGRDGTRKEARAGIWLADWLRRHWLERVGFQQYRRSEKFGT